MTNDLYPSGGRGSSATTYRSMTNAEAGAITYGMPVYAFGNNSVKKSVQAGPYAAARILGLVAVTTIAASSAGAIMVGRGAVLPACPINGTLAAGSDVWLDATAGTLTTTQLDPTAAGSVGKFLVRVGTIINYSAGVVADLLFDPGIPVGL